MMGGHREFSWHGCPRCQTGRRRGFLGTVSEIMGRLSGGGQMSLPWHVLPSRTPFSSLVAIVLRTTHALSKKSVGSCLCSCVAIRQAVVRLYSYPVLKSEMGCVVGVGVGRYGAGDAKTLLCLLRVSLRVGR